MKTNARSRRYTRDRRHAYGWEVAFHQTVDGKRRYFSALGTTRNAAIWNAFNSNPTSPK